MTQLDQPPRTGTEPAPWLAAACRDTPMGELVLSHDWASTPLGHPSAWTIALRTAVSICMSSRFPMLVLWGPELVKIYNDGYRPILGRDKHPGALGAPASRVWPEIWDVIGPMFDDVRTTGRPTWHDHERLVLERSGYPEECFFVWSYSALYDDDGSIGGVLDVVTETTAEVVAQRRLACLTALGSALVDAEQVTDTCLRAVNALGGFRDDVRSAELHVVVGDGLARLASNRRDDAPAAPAADLLDVALRHRPVVVGGAADGALPALEFAVPLGSPHAGVQGVLVVGLSPNRPFDDGYRSFLQLVASTIGGTLEAAYRRASELGEYRHISDTLQAAMLQPASDLPTVAARYVPAIGNLAVGGDWYDVIDIDDHRRGLVLGDCVGHGLESATVMAQLRSAARAMLVEGRDPATTLEGLDLFAGTLDGAFCTTVVCAIVDRDTDVITYSRAGHPPPLLVGGDGATWLDGGAGVPLAVTPGVRRTSASAQLRPDDLIVMYSDGLVERRGESLDTGLGRLADAVLRRRGQPVHHIADGLLRDLLPEGATDDVVLLVKSLPQADRHATA